MKIEITEEMILAARAHLDVHGSTGTVFNIEQALQAAIEKGLESGAIKQHYTPVHGGYGVLHFYYTNHRGETAFRKVQPVEVYYGDTEYYPEPQWLMMAYDLDRKATRVFAMNKISNTEPFFHGLSPEELEALALITEEAGEVVQAAMKIVRHGMHSCHPVSLADNKASLEKEIGDMAGVASLACDLGILDSDSITTTAERKPRRVARFLHHLKIGGV